MKLLAKVHLLFPGDTLDEEEQTELLRYIHDAVLSWGGQRHPDDWLFNIKPNVTKIELTSPTGRMLIQQKPAR
jgi:hypothetical protein